MCTDCGPGYSYEDVQQATRAALAALGWSQLMWDTSSNQGLGQWGQSTVFAWDTGRNSQQHTHPRFQKGARGEASRRETVRLHLAAFNTKDQNLRIPLCYYFPMTFSVKLLWTMAERPVIFIYAFLKSELSWHLIFLSTKIKSTLLLSKDSLILSKRNNLFSSKKLKAWRFYKIKLGGQLRRNMIFFFLECDVI